MQNNAALIDVNVFNGTENRLYERLNVLVESAFNKVISQDSIETKHGVTMIDGHTHIMINGDYAVVERDMDLVGLEIRGAIVEVAGTRIPNKEGVIYKDTLR